MAKKNNLLILLIFSSFFILRTWLISKTIPFGWDQQRDAQVISKIMKDHSLPLIGPRVVGDNGFFLGPYFFYLLLPFYFLTALNPIAIIYFVVFISLIFFITTYFSIKKIFNQKIALIYLFLWGVLPLTVNIDRITWNPILIPLSFSSLLLIIISIKNKAFNFILLGFILGLTFHFHFQGLFYVIFVMSYLLKSSFNNLKNYFLIILGFLLTFIPLLVFDLRHEFINSKIFINFFFSSNSIPHSLFSFLPVWINFIAKLTGINNLLFSIFVWFLLLIYGFINRKIPFFFASLILLLCTPVAFALYGQRPSEYYFVYLLPIIILFASSVLSKIKLNPYIYFIFILITTIFSFMQIKENSLSFFYKNEIVKKAKNILKDQSVYVTYNTPLGENNGFDYLVSYYQINRSEDSTRPGVQFIIPKKDFFLSVGNISLFIPENL